MTEHEEILFNLFIMAFCEYISLNYLNEISYEWEKNSLFFRRLVDCFPENEKYSESFEMNYIEE